MSDIHQQPPSSPQDQNIPQAAPSYRTPTEQEKKQTGWVGWVFFAGTIMILTGVFQAIAGLVALFRNTYYLVTNDQLLLTVNYAAWGGLHLLIGLIIIAGGLAVMKGALWGRVLGVILASLSALANLAFLAAYPFWSTIMIAMDILVIFALTVHGDEVKS